MRIEFVGKNIELTQSLKDVAEKKFQKLDKFIGCGREGCLLGC